MKPKVLNSYAVKCAYISKDYPSYLQKHLSYHFHYSQLYLGYPIASNTHCSCTCDTPGGAFREFHCLRASRAGAEGGRERGGGEEDEEHSK